MIFLYNKHCFNIRGIQFYSQTATKLTVDVQFGFKSGKNAQNSDRVTAMNNSSIVVLSENLAQELSENLAHGQNYLALHVEL